MSFSLLELFCLSDHLITLQSKYICIVMLRLLILTFSLEQSDEAVFADRFFLPKTQFRRKFESGGLEQLLTHSNIVTHNRKFYF